MAKITIETKYSKGDRVWAVVRRHSWYSVYKVIGPDIIEHVGVQIRDDKITNTTYALKAHFFNILERNCFSSLKQAQAECDRQN